MQRKHLKYVVWLNIGILTNREIGKLAIEQLFKPATANCDNVKLGNIRADKPETRESQMVNQLVVRSRSRVTVQVKP